MPGIESDKIPQIIQAHGIEHRHDTRKADDVPQDKQRQKDAVLTPLAGIVKED